MFHDCGSAAHGRNTVTHLEHSRCTLLSKWFFKCCCTMYKLQHVPLR